MTDHQCYVCGVKYDTLNDMKDHIMESHEEGSDFVLCPRCGFPVRDLKVHYKVKHPGWDLPKGVQHRSTVWRDFSSGKKKTSTMKFRKGTFISDKMHGKELYYRSSYECEVYELLEQNSDVIQYDAEPLEIPYLFRGSWHKYRPDLSILFADGRKELWEIKPGTQTNLPVNQAKWSSAQAFCDSHGWGFVVMTEIGIGKLRKLVESRRQI